MQTRWSKRNCLLFFMCLACEMWTPCLPAHNWAIKKGLNPWLFSQIVWDLTAYESNSEVDPSQNAQKCKFQCNSRASCSRGAKDSLPSWGGKRLLRHPPNRNAPISPNKGAKQHCQVFVCWARGCYPVCDKTTAFSNIFWTRFCENLTFLSVCKRRGGGICSSHFLQKPSVVQ